MSEVIYFLEGLGQTAAPLSPDQLMQAVAAFPDGERHALVTGDMQALAACIGARTSMVCAIVVPENEPDAPDEQPEHPEYPEHPQDSPEDTESRAA